MVSQASLGPTKEERIALWREQYCQKSEDELYVIVHSNIDSSDCHIAAKQLLSALNEGRANQRHAETIAQSTRANKLSILALVISIFSAIAALAALALQWRDLVH